MVEYRGHDEEEREKTGFMARVVSSLSIYRSVSFLSICSSDTGGK